jgi:uncharacterized Zn-finger protein
VQPSLNRHGDKIPSTGDVSPYTFAACPYNVGAHRKHWSSNMAGHGIPHFQNDGGHRLIEVGVKEFMCTGANVPFDHPHIYIDMGDDNEKVCSYCSTLYRYNPALKAEETIPAGCTFHVKAA